MGRWFVCRAVAVDISSGYTGGMGENAGSVQCCSLFLVRIEVSGRND